MVYRWDTGQESLDVKQVDRVWSKGGTQDREAWM